MRVALFLPSLAGGGAERVALALVAALREKGCHVDLLLVRREGELLPLVADDVRVVELGGGRIMRSLPPLVRYLRREKPEALHAFMWPLTVLAVVARRLARAGTRVIVSDHTTLSRHASGSRELRAMRLTIRRFYPSAAARIQVSQAAADDMAALSGLARSSIEVIANPLLVPDEIRATTELERLWAAPPGERILTIGSLKQSKDHRTLLHAFARLSRPGARLMVVGDGVLRPELETLAGELGIADRVIWAGFHLDPWPFYASANLFVLASQLEGQPIVLLEALASGLPIVSTDCPSGPREVLDDGRYGRLVPVGDVEALAEAMARALSSRSDPAELRRRAAELLESGSLERHLALLLD